MKKPKYRVGIFFLGLICLVIGYLVAERFIINGGLPTKIVEKVNKNKKQEPKKEDAKKEEVKSNENALVKNSNHIQKSEPKAYSTADVRAFIRREKPYVGKKMVFLTFDDGPNLRISPKILDVLKEKNVLATFFLVGQNLEPSHESVVKRELAEGHAIAMHSFTHDYHTLYPGRRGNTEAIINEEQKTEQRLQEILGKDFKSSVWRYPGGHLSWKGLEGSVEGLKKDGVEWMDWNALAGDAEPRSRAPKNSEQMLTFLKNSVEENKNKDVIVVLMHDAPNKVITLKTLPSIIDYFKAEGYDFGILK